MQILTTADDKSYGLEFNKNKKKYGNNEKKVWKILNQRKLVIADILRGSGQFIGSMDEIDNVVNGAFDMPEDRTG